MSSWVYLKLPGYVHFPPVVFGSPMWWPCNQLPPRLPKSPHAQPYGTPLTLFKVFYLGLAVGSVSAICNIYINATVSTRVSPSHQAYVLNLLETIFSVAGVLGSLTADNLFGWLIETKTVR